MRPAERDASSWMCWDFLFFLKVMADVVKMLVVLHKFSIKKMFSKNYSERDMNNCQIHCDCACV